MNTISIIITIVIIALIISISAFIYYSKRTKKLTESKKKLYIQKIREISKLTPFQKMLKYDSLLHQILKDLGYEGSLGEQLKQKPQIIKNKLDAFWKLHKLRNVIAHEINELSENTMDNESKNYERELMSILN